MSSPSTIIVTTDLGEITLRLLPESAPKTVAYIIKIVQSRLYDDTTFYRSDFVIQFGLHGTRKRNPHGDLDINETGHGGRVVSNTRGTVAVAHFDVPDCGGPEIFINLGDNTHLDSAYGGFCVFARIDNDDTKSFQVVDVIAAAVKKQGNVRVQSAVLR